MNKFYDVCIVGGGASGLAVAVYIKQNNRSISVAILERLNRVGKKLITTGNGRCNITNADESVLHYHGENPGFAEYALKRFNNAALEQFFSSIGVPFWYDETGRAYPASLQASAVVDALRFAAAELGVDVYTECNVCSLSGGKKHIIKTDKGEFAADGVIIAAGLYSGGARLGCDGSVLKMLKSAGKSVIKVTPAIVQIKTENTITKQLKGIKVNAAAALYIGGKLIRKDEGEVLFCDYGLSGPPVLQIAREVERQIGEKEVSLDLMPDKSESEVVSLLLSLKSALYYRNLDEFLSGALNKRLGQTVIKAADLKISNPVSSLGECDIKRIAATIKNFRFKVLSTTGFENSQVTAGGLNTADVDEKTMMFKTDRGVYAIGEILDIDGDCGGYNLHFAFSSAFCAAENIIEEYKNDKN